MRIKRTIIGVLKDPSLMKDIFSGLGYFMLTGGIAKIFISSGAESSMISKLIIIAFIMALLTFASLFWLIHVVRPIIKMTWPEFGIPDIDDGASKLPFKQLVRRLDVWVYILVGTTSVFLGWSVFQWVITAQ